MNIKQASSNEKETFQNDSDSSDSSEDLESDYLSEVFSSGFRTIDSEEDFQAVKQKLAVKVKTLFAEAVALKMEYIKKQAEFKAAKNNLVLLKAVSPRFKTEYGNKRSLKTIAAQPKEETAAETEKSNQSSDSDFSDLSSSPDEVTDSEYKVAGANKRLKIRKGANNNDGNFNNRDLVGDNENNHTEQNHSLPGVTRKETIQSEAGNQPKRKYNTKTKAFNNTMAAIFEEIHGAHLKTLDAVKQFICKCFAQRGHIASVRVVKEPTYSITLNNQYLKCFKVKDGVIKLESWSKMDAEKVKLYLNDSQNFFVQAVFHYCIRYEFIFDLIILLPKLGDAQKLFEQCILDTFDDEVELHGDDLRIFMEMYRKRGAVIRTSMLSGSIEGLIRTFFSIKGQKSDCYKVFISYLFEHHIFKKVFKKGKVNFNKISKFDFNKAALGAITGVYLKSLGDQDYAKYEIYDGFLDSIETILHDSLEMDSGPEIDKGQTGVGDLKLH